MDLTISIIFDVAPILIVTLAIWLVIRRS